MVIDAECRGKWRPCWLRHSQDHSPFGEQSCSSLVWVHRVGGESLVKQCALLKSTAKHWFQQKPRHCWRGCWFVLFCRGIDQGPHALPCFSHWVLYGFQLECEETLQHQDPRQHYQISAINLISLLLVRSICASSSTFGFNPWISANTPRSVETINLPAALKAKFKSWKDRLL